MILGFALTSNALLCCTRNTNPLYPILPEDINLCSKLQHLHGESGGLHNRIFHFVLSLVFGITTADKIPLLAQAKLIIIILFVTLEYPQIAKYKKPTGMDFLSWIETESTLTTRARKEKWFSEGAVTPRAPSIDGRWTRCYWEAPYGVGEGEEWRMPSYYCCPNPNSLELLSFLRLCKVFLTHLPCYLIHIAFSSHILVSPSPSPVRGASAVWILSPACLPAQPRHT